MSSPCHDTSNQKGTISRRVHRASNWTCKASADSNSASSWGDALMHRPMIRVFWTLTTTTRQPCPLDRRYYRYYRRLEDCTHFGGSGACTAPCVHTPCTESAPCSSSVSWLRSLLGISHTPLQISPGLHYTRMLVAPSHIDFNGGGESEEAFKRRFAQRTAADVLDDLWSLRGVARGQSVGVLLPVLIWLL